MTHRKELAALGLIKDAHELSKMVKRSARQDRRDWLAEGLSSGNKSEPSRGNGPRGL